MTSRTGDFIAGPNPGRVHAECVLVVPLPDAVIDRIADIAAQKVTEQRHLGDSDGWLRGAEAIGAYIAAPASRVYALASCKPQRIPIHRDGSALVAQRSELDRWMTTGGGKRP
jgi:hypothetical protein